MPYKFIYITFYIVCARAILCEAVIVFDGVLVSMHESVCLTFYLRKY